MCSLNALRKLSISAISFGRMLLMFVEPRSTYRYSTMSSSVSETCRKLLAQNTSQVLKLGFRSAVSSLMQISQCCRFPPFWYLTQKQSLGSKPLMRLNLRVLRVRLGLQDSMVLLSAMSELRLANILSFLRMERQQEQEQLSLQVSTKVLTLLFYISLMRRLVLLGDPTQRLGPVLLKSSVNLAVFSWRIAKCGSMGSILMVKVASEQSSKRKLFSTICSFYTSTFLVASAGAISSSYCISCSMSFSSFFYYLTTALSFSYNLMLRLQLSASFSYSQSGSLLASAVLLKYELISSQILLFLSFLGGAMVSVREVSSRWVGFMNSSSSNSRWPQQAAFFFWPLSLLSSVCRQGQRFIRYIIHIPEWSDQKRIVVYTAFEQSKNILCVLVGGDYAPQDIIILLTLVYQIVINKIPKNSAQFLLPFLLLSAYNSRPNPCLAAPSGPGWPCGRRSSAAVRVLIIYF